MRARKPFQFQQFNIYQDKTAMKVGTDGVLLGAWAAIEKAKTILDIGTGTGLLALMCAQRNSQTLITAIEIDKDAVEQAQENIDNSPWPDRVVLFHQSLQEFLTTNVRFDHIICNPPFFVANKHMQEDARKTARQESELNISELAKAEQLLNPNGGFSFIYPYDRKEDLITVFNALGLYLKRSRIVIGRIGAKPKRILLEFGKKPTIHKEESELVLEPHKRHEYSQEFKDLTKDFYIKTMKSL